MPKSFELSKQELIEQLLTIAAKVEKSLDEDSRIALDEDKRPRMGVAYNEDILTFFFFDKKRDQGWTVTGEEK